MKFDAERTCFLVLLVVAVAVAGCNESSTGGDGAPAELRSAETFDWAGQPITFALPPDGWRREITNQGGLLGAYFVKSGSVGEMIQIAEYTALADRDRCDELQAMLDTFDDMDSQDFSRAVHKARLYASPAFNRQEEQVTAQANETLERARAAFLRSDRDEALRELEVAARQAGRLHYELDDVIARVLYDPQGLPPYIKVDVGEPEPTEFHDKPAVRQSYTLTDSGRSLAGRRLYVVHDNHLFVAGFQGLEENIHLFEQIVATIRFEPRSCRS
jgi:hypothetical protein